MPNSADYHKMAEQREREANDAEERMNNLRREADHMRVQAADAEKVEADQRQRDARKNAA